MILMRRGEGPLDWAQQSGRPVHWPTAALVPAEGSAGIGSNSIGVAVGSTILGRRPSSSSRSRSYTRATGEGQ